jgi:hypothetical protein
MPFPLPNRCTRPARCLLVFLGLALLCSCAGRPVKIRLSAGQALRLETSESYAVSVLCECKATESCATDFLQHLLTSALRTHGVRLVHPSKATRTVALDCREMPSPPRNEPPLAPGSRLWYQRRVFSPVFVRTSSNPRSPGPLEMKVTIRATQTTGGALQPKPFQATMLVTDKSENGLKTAVDLLVGAIR